MSIRIYIIIRASPSTSFSCPLHDAYQSASQSPQMANERVFISFNNKNIMSKLSPFRRTANTYLNEYSPAYNQNKNDKQKPRRPNPVQQTNKRYYNPDDQPPKLTEKKRYQQINNIDIQSLLEKNKGLAGENAELYMMLQERGKIIIALEKKLEDQVRAEIMTLEAIEFQKAKFIGESHKKFKDYERKIEELINQIYRLNEEKEHGNFVNAQEMSLLKDTLNHEQIQHFQSMAQNQMSARQQSQFQKMKMRSLLQTKNNEITLMALQFQASTDKLKNEVVTLNNQIVHIHHMKKMELSEQKIMFENAIDHLKKDHNKEKELLILGHNMEIKKLANLIDSMENQVDQLGEAKKIEEIQQNNRELDLIEDKSKLEQEISSIEEFHRRSNFQETQKLKELNKNQIQAIETSTNAIVTNLKTENAKLINIVNAKSQEIDRLLGEVHTLRSQHNQNSEKYERMIDQLKEKLRNIEMRNLQEQQNFKVKYAQLREADIRALKEFYEHQVQVLNKDLFQKNHLANKNRALLHEELHYKNQMRKNFDIEILKLTSRIGELELRLNEKLIEKKEEVKSASEKMQMTSDILLRETKDKEKLNQINEEEKRNLQDLIRMKDKEIQELNAKITMINKNNSVQVAQKNAQIQLLKKAKDDIEVQLKKEKYFYDNQLKRKDMLIKNNKEIYNNDIERLKTYHREQLQANIKQTTSKINLLQVQLNKYRAVQKNLKNQVSNLHQSKQEEIKSKSNHLELEKQRMYNERKDSLEKLQRYYQSEMAKLTTQVSDLKKQLIYKEEDLRGMTDKYHRLQQKLEMVIQSQQKLKDMENRILAMGQDNNIVKNISEIIKMRSR